jgi:hypothetical protein
LSAKSASPLIAPKVNDAASAGEAVTNKAAKNETRPDKAQSRT